MHDARSLALALIFAAWWVISALNQFHSGAWMARVRRHIALGLIPLWTFFAPNPARADSRLVWRGECGGVWGGWCELHFGFAPLRRRWLLNPELILNKAISDLTGSLLRLRPDAGDRSLLLSSSYVTLLSVVLDQPRPPQCTCVQFAIVRTSTTGPSRRVDVAFLSEVHETADSLTHV